MTADERRLSDAESEAVGRAVRSAALTVDAPASLRARLAALERDAQRTSRRRRWVALVPAGGVAALAAVIVVMAVGGDGGPSLDDATAVALARPTAPGPAVDPADARLVRAEVAGIRFPNYGYKWDGWDASGERRDRLDGRDAVTVTYRGPVGDVGYTIVDGAPLDVPGDARRVASGGVRFAVLREDGATVVTWERDGHTCVLASRHASAQQMIAFATWT